MSDIHLFQQFGVGHEAMVDSANRRTVVYSRVSTKGQEDNTSLANQYETCMRTVERQSLEVVKEFGGKGESAKSGSARTEYERMLRFVRDPENRIRFIVFYAYDRFSREGGKAIVTKQELKALGISVISATMPIDTSNPMGEGMEDMQLIWAKIDNDVRRKRCIDGTRAKLKQGHWCGTAPIGYKWVNGAMLIDPVRGPLIRKAFEWKYKNPSMTSEEVRRKLKVLGLSISKQTMSRMFRNPLYCGLLAHSVLKGEVVEAKHEHIISRKIFLAVNGVMNDKNANGWQVNEDNDNLPLKKFLRCESCGNPLTGYENKTKNGKPRKNPIPYYKCRTAGCGVNKNANRLGDVFLKELKRYTINKDLVPIIAKGLRAALIDLNTEQFEEAGKMKIRVKAIEKKLERLRERYVLEEAITQHDYEEFSGRLRVEKNAILDELQKVAQKSSNLLDEIEDCIKMLANLAYIWENGDYRDKQRVQKTAFPEGMYYCKESDRVRTPRVNEIVRLSSEMSMILAGKKKGQDGLKTILSHSVPGGGLEPPRHR